jgi:hypothetical protein
LIEAKEPEVAEQILNEFIIPERFCPKKPQAFLPCK